MGFLPISVLLVTLILNRLLMQREKMERMEKLNIVVGTFFAEIRKDLLRYISKYDENIEEIAHELVNLKDFSEDDFRRVKDTLSQRKYFINIRRINLFELRRFLLDHKEFAIDLLDNPAVIEHETFTDLLWNVLHLTDELKRIINFDNLRERSMRMQKMILRRFIKFLYVPCSKGREIKIEL